MISPLRVEERLFPPLAEEPDREFIMMFKCFELCQGRISTAGGWISVAVSAGAEASISLGLSSELQSSARRNHILVILDKKSQCSASDSGWRGRTPVSLFTLTGHKARAGALWGRAMNTEKWFLLLPPPAFLLNPKELVSLLILLPVFSPIKLCPANIDRYIICQEQ